MFSAEVRTAAGTATFNETAFQLMLSKPLQVQASDVVVINVSSVPATSSFSSAAGISRTGAGAAASVLHRLARSQGDSDETANGAMWEVFFRIAQTSSAGSQAESRLLGIIGTTNATARAIALQDIGLSSLTAAVVVVAPTSSAVTFSSRPSSTPAASESSNATDTDADAKFQRLVIGVVVGVTSLVIVLVGLVGCVVYRTYQRRKAQRYMAREVQEMHAGRDAPHASPPARSAYMDVGSTPTATMEQQAPQSPELVPPIREAA